MKRDRLIFPSLMLVLSFISAYVCATAFVISIQLSLPPSDLAYGQPLGESFADPFWTIAATGASVVALVTFPVALFCLWHRNLLRSGLFVVGLTLIHVICITPIAPGIGLFGSPAVALFALLFCRFSHRRIFQIQEEA